MTSLDPLADDVLTELAQRPESGQIVLGGYFALRHHVDYRATHDVDAWWRLRADPKVELAIHNAMSKVAATHHLQLTQRRFGETVSFELTRGDARIFSFQIATRSIELEPPEPSAWPPIMIETLTDNIASKMNALVDRGSPRDLTDIYQVVLTKHVTINECWKLWERKNHGQEIRSAKQKVLMHLAALEQRRPIQTIVHIDERNRAREVRRWYREEFCFT